MWNEKDYKVYHNSNIGIYIYTYKEQLEILFGLFHISSGSTLWVDLLHEISSQNGETVNLWARVRRCSFLKVAQHERRDTKNKSCTNWRQAGRQAEILPPFDAGRAMKSLLKNVLSNTAAHFRYNAGSVRSFIYLFPRGRCCRWRRIQWQIKAFVFIHGDDAEGLQILLNEAAVLFCFSLIVLPARNKTIHEVKSKVF